MKRNKASCWTILAIGAAVLFAAAPARVSAQQNTGPTVNIGKSDLGGVVTGSNGPEAGVWVIAESTGLPTPFAKIVVTDDQGRYVIPDLPQANYDVWVRGYGLLDSLRVIATPGNHSLANRSIAACPCGSTTVSSVSPSSRCGVAHRAPPIKPGRP